MNICLYSRFFNRMASTLRTENIQTTIGQLNSKFAGRMYSDGYDETKLYHIHRRNRAFVWSKEMQSRLLDSIKQGYYIPPIICSSSVMNGKERREVMEGGNRITSFRNILENEIETLTVDVRRRVEAYPITVVVMRNLQPAQQREMFRRLNKNVKVTDGQLYAMSEDDSPLVQEAMSFLNDDDYPLRDMITDIFTDTRDADSNAKNLLANAVALISGALYGGEFMTKSFSVQEPKVSCQDPIDRQKAVDRLTSAFEIFQLADRFILPDGRKKKGQLNVGKWLGAILYDLQTNPNKQTIQDKWVNYILSVRRNEPLAEDASKISGAQNLNPTKLKRICVKVEIFVKEGRLLSDEELKTIVAEFNEYSDEEYSDDEV